jgi:HD domain
MRSPTQKPYRHWSNGSAHAALLHDTIEDTDTSVEELVEAFGGPVASLVQEVTDDKRLPKAERKLLQVEHAAHLSPKARSVKLADKIANLRDVADSPPVNWSLARRQEYFDWAKQGQPMTPSHAVKKGVRYRYYLSKSLLTGEKEATKGQRIPAAHIEALVTGRIRTWLADPIAVLNAVQCCGSDAVAQKRLLDEAPRLAGSWTARTLLLLKRINSPRSRASPVQRLARSPRFAASPERQWYCPRPP